MIFATKREYETLHLAYEIAAKLAEERLKRIEALGQQNAELKALFNKTSQFEIVEQDETTLRLKMKPADRGAAPRSGWRGKRSINEGQTHSTVNDSVAALNKRAEGDA